MIMHITDASTVKLQKLDGTYVAGMVNESLLKHYYDGHDMSWPDCIVHKKKKCKELGKETVMLHIYKRTRKNAGKSGNDRLLGINV